MDISEIIQTLQQCDLFGTLTEEQLRSIADLCGIETYEAGDAIFMQGEYGGKLYLIVEGQVVLQRVTSLGDREATVTVGFLGKGRVMGWSALLCAPVGRTATATCQKPAQVISLEGESLRVVLEKEPEMGFKVMERLAYVLGDRLQTAYTAMDTHL